MFCMIVKPYAVKKQHLEEIESHYSDEDFRDLVNRFDSNDEEQYIPVG